MIDLNIQQAGLDPALLGAHMDDEKLQEILKAYGYTDIQKVNHLWCGIQRFIFTCGVCYGLDATGFRGRFCFDTYQNALLFLNEWDGYSLPVVGIDGCTAIK